MRLKTLTGALLAGGLLLAACGDDDGGGASAGSNEYSEAVARSIKAEEDIPFADDEVDCLAREVVAAVGGPDALEEAGISPEDIENADDLSETDLDLGEEEASAVAASFGKCDISIADAFLDALGDDVPAEARGCIEDKLDEDTLSELFASSIVEGSDAGDLPPDLLTALTECFTG